MHRTRWLTAVSIAIVLSSCADPVPTAYGVYARHGRSLIDLSDEDSTNDFDLPVGVSLVVHERELTTPGLAPREAIRLFTAKWVRTERVVQLVVPARQAQELLNRGIEGVPVKDVSMVQPAGETLSKAAEWIIHGDPIAVRYEPVGESGEMLAVVPVEPLPKGGYYLRRTYGDDDTRFVGFAVGLTNDVADRQAFGCLDRHLYVVDRPQGFRGWDQFMKDVNSAWDERSRRVIDERPVVATALLPCSELDAKIDGWVAAFETEAPPVGQYVLMLAALRPDDEALKARVRAIATKRARMFLAAKDYHVVIGITNIAGTYVGLDGELLELHDTATREAAQAEAAEADRLAREEARVAARREQSRTPTQEIGTFAVTYRHNGKKYDLVLTDVNLRVPDALVPRRYGGTVRFADIPVERAVARLRPSRNWTRTGWEVPLSGCCSFDFDSEADATAFADALGGALEAWAAAYPEFVKR